MKPGVFVRSAYNYDRDAVSRLNGLSCEGSEDKAQQQFKDECDINVIARRFGLTGLLPQSAKVPTYADFDEIFDFQTAMNAVRQAQETFNALPAQLRERFANDPQNLLLFVEDPGNTEEAIKLGLCVPPSSAAPPQEAAPPAAG